ncbi:MAG: xanthine dehydrogenase accessory protein XdhC [Rickettsiales bacterium]|nr:xanthine dehydrogenase accessory protein XdhC [Rickettsiales bacterium]
MLKKIIDVKEIAEKIIKAKIILAEGSVPRNIGTFMFISKNKLFGSIGGGQLEYQITDISKKNLGKKNFKQEIINIPLGPSIGQCCGGYVQIKLELYKNGNEALKSEKNKSTSLNDLYIFGAGHVGQQLSSRVTDLDFNVNLIDSRENYLNLQTDKNVNKILAKNPWLLIKNLPTKSYFIILTHSHDYDFKIINEILRLKKFEFLGLIGSSTKFQRFKSRLIKLGHKNQMLNKIECPIGLKNISSKKPAEIAISIIGRILEFRTSLDKISKNDKDLLVKVNEQ